MLNYRPNLEIEKRYDTDGEVEPQILQTDTYVDEVQPSFPMPEMAEEILTFIMLSEMLPEKFQPTYNTLMNSLQFLYVQIDSDYIKGSSDNDETEEDALDPDISLDSSTDKDKSETDEEDDMLFSTSVDTYKISTIKKDPAVVINKKYSTILYELINYFLNEIRRLTADYFAEVEMIRMTAEDKSLVYIDKKYTYKTTDLKNQNLYHVSDYLIKIQIVRDQKQRMMNKIINDREAMTKIKSCEVARELLIRYCNTNKKPNKNYQDILKNASLFEMKEDYERKLDNNLYELYKYLNSSVILLRECLELYSQELQAKTILIKEEGLTI